MNWLLLAIANLRLSPLTTAVNVLLMALGTASAVLILQGGAQLADKLARDARGVDLVIGAKGSPAQLVLSSVYHADIPPGNISLAASRVWSEDPRVEVAAPVSLGDSFRGFRIVGTTAAYLDLLASRVERGSLWDAPLEAVIGASVAQATGLEIGSRFAGVHGFAEGGHVHGDRSYTVVGVLAPAGSVVDRLILTSLDSVWLLHETSETHSGDSRSHAGEPHDEEHDHELEEVHEHDEDHDLEEAHDHDEDHDLEKAHDHDEDHDPEEAHEHNEDHDLEEAHDHDEDHDLEEAHDHDEDHDLEEAHEHRDEFHSQGVADKEITALLLRYNTPLAALSLPREVNQQSALQAAAPAVEVTRLLRLVGVGLDGLRMFAWLLILSACLSVFAALYGSLRSRRGDLAMLRCLGATRRDLFVALFSEGLLLSLSGIVLGLLLGHGAIAVAGMWLEMQRGIAAPGFLWVPAELALLAVLLAISLVSAAIPGFQAYRSDVAPALGAGSAE